MSAVGDNGVEGTVVPLMRAVLDLPGHDDSGTLNPRGDGRRMASSRPRHVACVMDGNGRWAAQRSLPRTAGHEAAESAVIDVIDAAQAAGIEWLSLFAFSTENWQRPSDEIEALMRLAQRTIRKHALGLHGRGIRCRFLGDVDDGRISRSLARDLTDLMTLTSKCRRMTLTVAFGHGGRREIIDAARSLIRNGVTAEDVTEESFARHLAYPDTPDVDLVIRTSGEQRVSNFMLWRTAYAEWMFPEVLWPDFRATHFWECLNAYGDRSRRFGDVNVPTSAGKG